MGLGKFFKDVDQKCKILTKDDCKKAEKTCYFKKSKNVCRVRKLKAFRRTYSRDRQGKKEYPLLNTLYANRKAILAEAEAAGQQTTEGPQSNEGPGQQTTEGPQSNEYPSI